MITAHAATVGELFRLIPRFEVPAYQRRYQWGEPQVRQLWSDLTELLDSRRTDPSKAHLLGTIVLAPSSEAGAVSVVDGQQRLVTLAMLVAAIQDQLGEDGQTATISPSPVGDAVDGADRLLRAAH